MKTAILCGGRGTRLGEHGATVPKALIEIGGRPVLWHLMKNYSAQGLNEFVLCLGYLGNSIKGYFTDPKFVDNVFEIDDQSYRIRPEAESDEEWVISFAETGEDTNTGGRLYAVRDLLMQEERFCATYGDGLSDVDLTSLLAYHARHGKVGTLTAVNPRSSFGVLKLGENSEVREFSEKPLLKEWINGGFFVFERTLFEFLGPDLVLEREPFEALAARGDLMAFRHAGFWKCLDTYKDHLEFNQLWDSGKAEWRRW